MLRYISKEKNQIIRVFIGLSLRGTDSAVYSLTFQNTENMKTITFPPQVMQLNRPKKMNGHDYATVCLIKRIVEIVINSKKRTELVVLHVYTGSDTTSFIWETEYKKDHKLPEVYEWNEIAALTGNNHIDLYLYGEDSILNGINNVEKKKIKR